MLDWCCLLFEEQVEGSCACLCHVGDAKTQKCSPRTIMVVFAFFWPWLLAIFELTFFYQLLNFISAAAALPYFFASQAYWSAMILTCSITPLLFSKKTAVHACRGGGKSWSIKLAPPQNGLTWEMWHARVCQTTMEHCFLLFRMQPKYLRSLQHSRDFLSAAKVENPGRQDFDLQDLQHLWVFGQHCAEIDTLEPGTLPWSLGTSG